MEEKERERMCRKVASNNDRGFVEAGQSDDGNKTPVS